MRRAWRKGLVRTMVVLAALWIAYLIVGNLFLARWLEPLVNRKPEKVLLHVGRAWTVLPGWVHVRELRIRQQNRHAQWQATLDGATAWVGLLGFVHRDFHVHRVWGEGLEVRVRRRISPEAAPGPTGTPPIPGLSNPPSPPPEELYPPKGADARWTFRFDRFSVDEVREVWIDRYRWRGAGELRGGMGLHPKSWVRLDDLLLEVGSGEVLVEEEPAAGELEGSVRWDLPRFDLRARRPVEIFQVFGGEVRFEGRLEELTFLNLYLRNLPGFTVDGGRGRVRAEVVVHEGAFGVESRLEADLNDLRFGYLEWEALGTARLDWRVREPGTPRAELHVAFDEYALRGVGAEVPHVRGNGLRALVVTEDLRVAGAREDLRVEMEMPEARIDRFDYYDRYLPAGSGLRILGGTGTIAGRFEGTREEGEGTVDVAGEGIEAEYGGLGLRGNLDLATRIHDADLVERRFRLDGTRLEVTDAFVEGEEGGEPWWGRIEVSDAVLAMPKGEAAMAEVRARTVMKDTGPLVAVFSEGRPLMGLVQGRLTVPDAEGKVTLHARPDRVRLEDLVFEGDGLEVRGCLRASQGEREGALYVRSKRVDVGIELIPPDGRELHLLRTRKWFYERQEICPASR